MTLDNHRNKLPSNGIPNMFTCKPYQVDPDISMFTASEGEPVGLEHFLVQPECKEDLVSDFIDLDAFQIQKCFNMEDISGTFEYDQLKLDSDAVHPNLSQGEGKNLEFLYELYKGSNNGIVQGKDTSSTSEEFHLDAKYADIALELDHGPCKESYMGNVALESQAPEVCTGDSVNEILDLSSTNDPMLKYSSSLDSSLLDHIATKELHEAFKDVCDYETLDREWLQQHDFFAMKNHVEMENSMSLIKCGVTSSEHEGKMLSSIDYAASTTDPTPGAIYDETKSGGQQVKRKRLTSCDFLKTPNSEVSKVEKSSLDGEDNAETLVTQKRSRKPPRRYIEESLDYESKSYNKKCGIAYRRPNDRFLHVRSQKQKWQKYFQTEQVVCQDDCFDGNCIQVPFDLPAEKEHPKKNKSSVVQDSEDCKDNRLLCLGEKLDVEPFSAESQEDLSEDECVTRSYTKGSSRRKRHISWTPSEVVKLVEGVSQCGVGRWTEIKRLLFSSSSHRTSVDLKDKWRNLLRASCTQLQIKEKVGLKMFVEQGRKQASNNIPESVLWRVRELAVMYPYPRESKSKVSFTAPPAATNTTLVPLSTAV
ncbi:hypothetical protein FNV43_RR05417 [Rhamnella rubrinervis]|uniref:Uncharacterized protein n=1 Tax=Rhamnella rubrinervis TaxID=2594499 RepID=A0A8K0MR28_9ROSA|nr:hypothetical protein FNV43_RR05417 [Rhamnella rubrinervis]